MAAGPCRGDCCASPAACSRKGERIPCRSRCLQCHHELISDCGPGSCIGRRGVRVSVNGSLRTVGTSDAWNDKADLVGDLEGDVDLKLDVHVELRLVACSLHARMSQPCGRIADGDRNGI
eukprot:scaffold8119_cov258-Pinguiococcus_pyrenoidosus.AAC.2